MTALDTNVLLRWLVQDDPAQTAEVEQTFESLGRDPRGLFVPITVLLELEWVLRSRYRFDKATVLNTLTALLEAESLELQSEEAIEHALHHYRHHQADFADCLHLGLCSAARRTPMLTFDRTAARLPGAQHLRR